MQQWILKHCRTLAVLCVEATTQWGRYVAAACHRKSPATAAHVKMSLCCAKRMDHQHAIFLPTNRPCTAQNQVMSPPSLYSV
jgi:hypothetical protein